MKKLYLCLAFLFSILTTSYSQTSYTGNGASGFGGPVGGATMTLDDDGTTITATFTKGVGGFNDTMVMYISNGNTGRTSIDGNVNDTADANRRAISNVGSSSITFPAGFEATHAIAINTGFGGLWGIPSSGSVGFNGLTFVDAVGGPAGAGDTSFSFSFDWSEIGLTNLSNFDFVITYGNPNDSSSTVMFSSDEAFGGGISGSGNPGAGAMTYSDSRSYPNTWLGVDTDWSNAANWSEGLPTSTDNVYIPNIANQPVSVGAITIGQAVITAGASIEGQSTFSGDVILNSTSSSYSSLIIDGTISGTFTYHRYVNSNGGGNDLITPPLDGQTWASFLATGSNSSDLFDDGLVGPTTYAFAPFDKTASDYVNYDSSSSETLESGRTGYRAATDSGTTLTFVGTPLNGDQDINIIDSGSSFADWNLIGNPYPSYVSIQAFLEHIVDAVPDPDVTNISLLESASGIYGYDGDASDGWTVITLANDDGQFFAPGQGFFVAADDADVVAYDLEFTDAMRSNGSGDDFILGRNSSSSTLTFSKINISTATSSYNTEIYFDANATLGLDPGYDATIFGGSAPTFSIYSHLVQDNTGIPIALQAVGLTDVSDVTIPLGVNANAGEELTFDMSFFSLPPNIDVYLDDNVESTSTLLNSNDYVLTPASNLSGTGRFFLRFVDRALSVSDNTLDDLSIYTNQNTRSITIAGQLLDNTVANIYDIQGRLILNSALNMDLRSQNINVQSLGTGIYIVELSNGSQNKVEKIILK